jgi:hypothetical protein
MLTRSSTFAFGLFVATAVVLCWPAQSLAAQGGTARPFKGHAEGRVVAQIPPNQLVVNYTGRASHLGKFTRTENLFLNPDGTFTGTIVFTAANGDQLRLNLSGRFVSPTEAVGTYDFTGGTGRFSDATGHATFRATTPDGIIVEATFEGTISY